MRGGKELRIAIENAFTDEKLSENFELLALMLLRS
jgi:hypothetical protein